MIIISAENLHSRPSSSGANDTEQKAICSDIRPFDAEDDDYWRLGVVSSRANSEIRLLTVILANARRYRLEQIVA